MKYDFDNRFANVDQVNELVSQTPVLIEFVDLSEAVRDLIFEIHDHLDAIAGYADWYVHRKTPPNIYQGAFPTVGFFQRLDLVERGTTQAKDIHGIKRIREVAAFVDSLVKLIFRPKS